MDTLALGESLLLPELSLPLPALQCQCGLAAPGKELRNLHFSGLPGRRGEGCLKGHPGTLGDGELGVRQDARVRQETSRRRPMPASSQYSSVGRSVPCRCHCPGGAWGMEGALAQKQREKAPGGATVRRRREGRTIPWSHTCVSAPACLSPQLSQPGCLF